MRRALILLATLAIASCVTASPSASAWARIEGCWREEADHWPASMQWARDSAHAGGFVGQWRRDAAQGDVDEVQFRLTPAGDRMQLCQQARGGAESCTPAVFGRAGWRQEDVAVFDVNGSYHEFGYAGAPAPFFGGVRCG